MTRGGRMYDWRVCVPDLTPVPDTMSDCPQRDQHTPEPRDDIAWHQWAEGMSRTHRQTRCRGCELWCVWVPR